MHMRARRKATSTAGREDPPSRLARQLRPLTTQTGGLRVAVFALRDGAAFRTVALQIQK